MFLYFVMQLRDNVTKKRVWFKGGIMQTTYDYEPGPWHGRVEFGRRLDFVDASGDAQVGGDIFQSGCSP